MSGQNRRSPQHTGSRAGASGSRGGHTNNSEPATGAEMTLALPPPPPQYPLVQDFPGNIAVGLEPSPTMCYAAHVNQATNFARAELYETCRKLDIVQTDINVIMGKVSALEDIQLEESHSFNAAKAVSSETKQQMTVLLNKSKEFTDCMQKTIKQIDKLTIRSENVLRIQQNEEYGRAKRASAARPDGSIFRKYSM